MAWHYSQWSLVVLIEFCPNLGVLLNQKLTQHEKFRSGPGFVGIWIYSCGSGPVLNRVKTTTQIKTEKSTRKASQIQQPNFTQFP